MALRRSAALAVFWLTAGSTAAFATNDFRDVAVVSATISHVLEKERSGVEVPWSNGATGNSGYVMVERTYYVEGGKPCRDYRRSMESGDGRTLLVRGTGCRDAGGRWNLDEHSETEVAAATPPEDPFPSEPDFPREPDLPGGLPGAPFPGPEPEVGRERLPGSETEPSWSSGPPPDPAPTVEPEPDLGDPTPLPASLPAPAAGSPASDTEEDVASRSDPALSEPSNLPPRPVRRPERSSARVDAPSRGSGSVTVSLPSRSEG